MTDLDRGLDESIKILIVEREEEKKDNSKTVRSMFSKNSTEILDDQFSAKSHDE